ncbi:CHAD domain-containing protein [Methylocella sp.]|uniref:CYTH and CHAD domain-containing protein n=1 Tax=Methylocella sp. TaxID=1978226 RepID=UPI0035B47B8B
MSETELKLTALDGVAPPLDAFEALRPGAASMRKQRLRSWVFDTPDGTLRRAGFVLRLRQAGDALLQTVKTPGDGAFERGEWEAPVASPPPADGSVDAGALDFAMIAQTPLGPLVEEARGELVEVFRVDVERATLLVETGGAVVEAAADQGEIVAKASGARAAVAEIELELKGGDKRILFKLARELAAAAPLSLSLISKAERGFRLADGRAGQAQKASAPRIGDDASAADAFAAICHACLRDFMLNAAMLGRGARASPDAVHQGRIALRRLRAAFALFKPIVRDDAFDGAAAEVKRLARLFGVARDRDVMTQAALEKGEGGEAFRRWLADESARLHDEISQELAAPRWRLFLIDFCLWLDDGAWRAAAARRPKRIAKFARRRLRRRLKALARRGAALEALSPDDRHELRIDAKTLRYMGEFFAGARAVAPHKSMSKFLKRLEIVQSALGEMHDEEAKTEGGAADLARWRAEAGEVAPEEAAAAERFFEPAQDDGARLAAAAKALGKLARDDPF